MQFACQCGLVAYCAFLFFGNVYFDFNGREGRKPAGFAGFIGSIVASALIAALLYGAGAFDVLTN